MARSTAKFTISAEDRTKQAFMSATSGINNLERKFINLMGPITALVSAAGMGRLIQQTANTGDQFDKMSLRTGIAVEELSGLDYAAKITGSNIEAVEKSLKYLTNQMLDVSRGTGESRATFDELGISVRGANGEMRGTTDVLLDVADKLSGIDDETLKAAYAMEIFGAKAGASLIPMLKQGRDGIEELIRKNRELGGEWTELEAKQAAAFNDSLTDLKKAAGGLGRTIAVDLFPVLTDGATKMAKWAAQNREYISLKVSEEFQKGKDVIEKTTPALKGTADVMGRMIDGYTSLPTWVQTTGIVGALVGGMTGKIAVVGAGIWYDNIKKIHQLWKSFEGVDLHIGKDFVGLQYNPKDIFGGGDPNGGSGASRSFGVGPLDELKLELPVEILPKIKPFNKKTFADMPFPELGMEMPDMTDYWDDYIDSEKTRMDEIGRLYLRLNENRIMLDYTGIEQQKELLNLWFADEYGMMEEHDERKKLARQVLHGDIELLERDHLERLQNENEQAILRFGSMWGGILYDMQRRSGNVFDNIVDGFSDMLQRMAMQAAMAGIFNLATGGVAGGFMGGVTTFLKGALGFKAAGGPVRAGSPYVVGERGPELMVPGASGTILPAMKTAPTTIDNSRTTINAIWQSNQKPGAMDVYAFARMLRDADDLGLLDKMKKGGARG